MSSTTVPTDAPRASSRRSRWSLGLAAGALVVAAIAGSTAAEADGGQPPVPAADGSVIWEWNETAMGVLTPSGRPLLTQPFVITAMHVAMYDAVVAIEGFAEPFATAITAAPGASSEAAAATAAHRVLVGFLPSDAGVFDAALTATLAEIPDGPAERDGIAVGEAAGWGTLAYRLGDGTQAGVSPHGAAAGTRRVGADPTGDEWAGTLAGERHPVHRCGRPISSDRRRRRPWTRAGSVGRSTRSAASGAPRRRNGPSTRRRSPGSGAINRSPRVNERYAPRPSDWTGTSPPRPGCSPP